MKINPILIKELKVRARSIHIPMLVLIYNALMAFVGIFMLISSVDMLNISGTLNYGKMNDMFLVNGLFQCVILILVSVSVSVSSFAGEKERGTLDMLYMTPVTNVELVNGKLLSCVLTGFLFAFSSLPILMLGTIHGGTNLVDVLYLEMVLLVLAFSVSARGVFWSILMNKTSVAMIFSLVTEVAFLIGPFVLLAFVDTFLYNGYQYSTEGYSVSSFTILFQVLNPFMLMLGFCERIEGQEMLINFLIYDYGIWEDSGLYVWLEQYFILACTVCQIIFTFIVYWIDIKILKKGRSIV